MRKIKFLLGTFILSFIFFWISSSPVFACSPVAPQPNTIAPTLEDHTNNANWIMIGTVIGGIEELDVITEAEIEVERYLKGEGEAIVHIQGFGHGTACLTTVEVGDTYIFFANGNISNTFNALYYENRRPIVRATEDNIEQIFAITNHSVAPSAMSITMQIERAIAKANIWHYVMVSSGMILLVLGVFIIRKPKQKRKRS